MPLPGRSEESCTRLSRFRRPARSADDRVRSDGPAFVRRDRHVFRLRRRARAGAEGRALGPRSRRALRRLRVCKTRGDSRETEARSGSGPAARAPPGRARCASVLVVASSAPGLRETWRPERRTSSCGDSSSPAQVRQLMPADGTSNGSSKPAAVDPSGDVAQQVSVLDLTNYTKNVLLRDTDAMTANSLEVRVPYLDDGSSNRCCGSRAHSEPGTAKPYSPPLSETCSRKRCSTARSTVSCFHSGIGCSVTFARRSLPPSMTRLLQCRRFSMSGRCAMFGPFLLRRAAWLRPWALHALCKWAESLAQQPKLNARS